MDTSKLTPGVVVILAAGVVALVFSFLTFYEVDFGGQAEDLADQAIEVCREQAEEAGLDPDAICDIPEDIATDVGGEETFTAWSDGLFPVATLPAIFGVLMAAQVALTKLFNVTFPDRVLGLTWGQVHIAFGVNAALIMLAYLVRDKGAADFGLGFFLMLVASLALAVGAFIYQREESGSPSSPPPGA